MVIQETLANVHNEEALRKKKTINFANSLADLLRFALFDSAADFNKNKMNNAEFLKEGFYDIKETFIYKGVYSSTTLTNNKNAKNKNEKNPNNNLNNNTNAANSKSKHKRILIEVYLRKIKTSNGDLIEFLFEDITQIRDRELSTNPNKNIINANILEKFSHEFKTPLITMIYILNKHKKKASEAKTYKPPKSPKSIRSFKSPLYKASKNNSSEFNNEEISNRDCLKRKKKKLFSEENSNTEESQRQIKKAEANSIENAIDLSNYMFSLVSD